MPVVEHSQSLRQVVAEVAFQAVAVGHDERFRREHGGDLRVVRVEIFGRQVVGTGNVAGIVISWRARVQEKHRTGLPELPSVGERDKIRWLLCGFWRRDDWDSPW